MYWEITFPSGGVQAASLQVNEDQSCTVTGLEPGTAIPIHRHRHTSETYAILRGRMFVVFYDSMGGAVERILLDPKAGKYGVHIPAGQWHAVEVIEPSVILEVKDGPYIPLQPEDTLD